MAFKPGAKYRHRRFTLLDQYVAGLGYPMGWGRYVKFVLQQSGFDMDGEIMCNASMLESIYSQEIA